MGDNNLYVYSQGQQPASSPAQYVPYQQQQPQYQQQQPPTMGALAPTTASPYNIPLDHLMTSVHGGNNAGAYEQPQVQLPGARLPQHVGAQEAASPLGATHLSPASSAAGAPPSAYMGEERLHRIETQNKHLTEMQSSNEGSLRTMAASVNMLSSQITNIDARMGQLINQSTHVSVSNDRLHAQYDGRLNSLDNRLAALESDHVSNV